MVQYINQDAILRELNEVFGEEHVHQEWDVVKESQDAYSRVLYCPRIDFAVDPFNIDSKIKYNNILITQKYEEYLPLFNLLIKHSDFPNNCIHPNDNPRCFLTIEHENKVTRKHMIGTIINSSAIGKVGIIIAAQDKTYEALSKIRKYLDALVEYKKLNYKPENIIIIKYNEFTFCMDNYKNNINNQSRTL